MTGARDEAAMQLFELDRRRRDEHAAFGMHDAVRHRRARRDQPRQVRRLAAAAGQLDRVARAARERRGRSCRARLQSESEHHDAERPNGWRDQRSARPPTSATASARRDVMASSMPMPESRRSTSELHGRPSRAERRSSRGDIELPLDERVRQLAGHESEARGRAERRVRMQSRDPTSRATPARSAAEQRERGGRRPAPSRRTRGTSCSRRTGVGRATCSPPSSGSANARDTGVANHAVCATPASVNASRRNAPQAVASSGIAVLRRRIRFRAGSGRAGRRRACCFAPRDPLPPADLVLRRVAESGAGDSRARTDTCDAARARRNAARRRTPAAAAAASG